MSTGLGGGRHAESNEAIDDGCGVAVLVEVDRLKAVEKGDTWGVDQYVVGKIEARHRLSLRTVQKLGGADAPVVGLKAHFSARVKELGDVLHLLKCTLVLAAGGVSLQRWKCAESTGTMRV